MKHSLVMLLVLVFSMTALAAEMPKVEGVLLDPDTPEASSAVVNGAIVTAGEAVGDYTVEAFESDAVQFRHRETGESLRVEVLAHRAKTPAPVLRKTAAPAETSSSAKEQPAWLEALRYHVERLFRKAGTEDEAAPGRRPAERRAMDAMQRIFQAGMKFYLKTKDKPADIRALIASRDLAPDYDVSVRADYRFWLNTKSGEMGIHASPLEPSKGYLHFFLDQAYIMHVSETAPATKDSPVFEF